MEDLNATTIENIAKARSVRGIPVSERMVEYASFADCLKKQTEKYGDKTYLIYTNGDTGEEVKLSYNELSDRVSQVADFMTNGLGLKLGDRVATLMYNHYKTVLVCFAAWKIGVVVVPTNIGEDDERVVFTLQNSGASAAFVREEQAERIDRIRSRCAGDRQLVQVGGKAREGFLDFEKEVGKCSTNFEPDEMPTLDDDAFVVYTSGTTGAPKGVVLDHYDLLVDAKGIAEWHEMKPEHRMMCILPIHHVNGTIVTLCTPLYYGGSVVLNRRFQTKHFWANVSKYNVHVVSVVPTILHYLCEADSDMSKYDIAHFRHIICGAGPLTVGTGKRFEDTFGIRIVHGYGLSETTCYSCFLPLDLDGDEHKGWMREHGFPSIGCAIEPNEMAIHDPEGNAIGDNDRGEIVIRGHNVMKYYYNRPDANADAFKYGWFRSGDEGFTRTDSQGRVFFFITGRMKELIIRGGINISPLEIDEILTSIPGVRTGLCVGFENDAYGEEIGAYLELEDGAELTEEQVIAATAETLPFNKQPKVVIFGSDIPVTATGKYQRNKLKHLYKDYLSVQFRKKK